MTNKNKSIKFNENELKTAFLKIHNNGLLLGLIELSPQLRQVILENLRLKEIIDRADIKALCGISSLRYAQATLAAKNYLNDCIIEQKKDFSEEVKI